MSVKPRHPHEAGRRGWHVSERREARAVANDPEQAAEHSMENADGGDGEGRQTHDSGDEPVNDTEERYGLDENPA
jgi:hypothetical protein